MCTAAQYWQCSIGGFHTVLFVQRLDESELKLYLKQLQKQFVKGSKGDAAQDDQVHMLFLQVMMPSCQDIIQDHGHVKGFLTLLQPGSEPVFVSSSQCHYTHSAGEHVALSNQTLTHTPQSCAMLAAAINADAGCLFVLSSERVHYDVYIDP